MNSKRIYLSPPHMSGHELEFVKKAFESNWIAPIGPDVDALEKEMCAYTGAQHSVALSSGTAAIHLALLLLHVKKDDIVLCSTFTFAGSAFPIAYQNAVPVFIDSEEVSWNMDPQLLEDAIRSCLQKGKKPKAVIAVHLYGQSADLDPIIAICKQYDIALIEDAAESIGGLYKQKHTGSIARFGVFSFNGNKIITTSGGGMLAGSNKDEIDKARFFATQARDPAPYYEHTQIGYNYRMSNIVAAIGRGQVKVIDERVRRRREIFDFYKTEIGSIKGISFMPEPQWSRSNRWLTCILIDKNICAPEDLRLALESENIESRPLWKPMHLQPVFGKNESFVNGTSEKFFDTGLCLPSGTAMTEEDLQRVVRVVREKIKAI